MGTGTSTGNPEIGCRCEVCTSTDRRDWRFRSSILVETNNHFILIDCGPDFRMQMLETLKTWDVGNICCVLLTHEHYDHVAGLDDLRSFCKQGPVQLYAEKNVMDAIRYRMPYVFAEKKYPGIPDLALNDIDNQPFSTNDIEIIPIRLIHGCLPIFGYRIGKMAYLTDLKDIPDEELSKLKGLDVLIINSLRKNEHIAHQTTTDALRNIEKINPKQAYLIHMSHHFGLHAAMEKTMPPNVYIAYDGLEIDMV